jgi:putative membrane protein insertion efficiency factor
MLNVYFLQSFLSMPYKSIAYGLRFLIFCYQMIFSISSGRQCRFEPTCSCYANQALRHHNSVKALWLILKRLYKCSPFSRYRHDWYYDPVPLSCSDDDDDKEKYLK